MCYGSTQPIELHAQWWWVLRKEWDVLPNFNMAWLLGPKWGLAPALWATCTLPNNGHNKDAPLCSFTDSGGTHISPRPFPHSRFLVLVALQPAHLTRVHLGCVHVFVDHELVLADAGKGKTKAVVRPGKREASG